MVIILMGVSGVGKTTVGELLAKDLDWLFHEGDDHHPPDNVLKMAQGVPLTDEDRWPWLDAIHDLITSVIAAGKNAVITCSALKQEYRHRLVKDHHGEVTFVYLKGDYELIRHRLADRTDHFMNIDLLESQFHALEEPEETITIDVTGEPREIVDAIKLALPQGTY